MKRAIIFCLCILLLLFYTACGQNQSGADYPSDTIELVCGYGAGGQSDLIARILAQYMPKYLPNNPTIVVTNSPGASGMIAINQIEQEKHDGYTLGIGTSNMITYAPDTQGVEFDRSSITPLCVVAKNNLFLTVSQDSPWKSAEDLIDYWRANPGTTFNVASLGLGTASDYMCTKMSEVFGVDFIIIPYTSGSEAISAMLKGETSAYLGWPMNYDPARMRVCISFSAEESDIFGDVPTFVELGWDSLQVDISDFVLWCPADVDDEIKSILVEAISKVCEDEEALADFAKIPILTYFCDMEATQERMDYTYDLMVPYLTEYGFIQ